MFYFPRIIEVTGRDSLSGGIGTKIDKTVQVLKTPVSRDQLGRVFNGSGMPIDGGYAPASVWHTVGLWTAHVAIAKVRMLRTVIVCLQTSGLG